jgi:hypothetical protein
MSPRQQLLENNYLLIDSFISPERATNLLNSYKGQLEQYPYLFTKDEQCPLSYSMYNFRDFLNLLCEKLPTISEIMEENMLPSYTYARLYTHGDELKKHKDRPSCEISLTVHLGGDAPWDIWFTKPNGEQASVTMTLGQAVMYIGTLSEHWRDKFAGQEYMQVFLHYVRGTGEHWEHFGDRSNVRSK